MTVLQGSSILDRLTPREYEVAEMVASGRPYEGVANALDITTSTVKVHAMNAAEKLPGPGRPNVKISRCWYLFASSNGNGNAS